MNDSANTLQDADDVEDPRESLVDLGLQEILGDAVAPDLSDQILALLDSDPAASVPFFQRRIVRIGAQVATVAAAATCLFWLWTGLEYRLRVAARRADVINNSRQIGLAALNHENALYRFPTVTARSGKPPSSGGYSGYGGGGYGDGGGYGGEGGLVTHSDATSAGAKTNFTFAQVTLLDQSDSMAHGGAGRKICYRSTVNIVVEEFGGVLDRVTKLVTEHKGFVAHSNLGQMRGKQRSGNWVLRIPIENYQSFLNSLDEVGVLDSRNESAQDLTVAYVDLESGIVNKKKLEERIIKLLERTEDELKEVIQVEQELARVRGEIEGMEGRLRMMKDQTSLATITLNVREELDYVPPKAPTVSSRLGNAWSNGFSRTGNFVMDLAIWFIERLIPIVGCSVAAICLLWLVRRWWAKRKVAVEV